MASLKKHKVLITIVSTILSSGLLMFLSLCVFVAVIVSYVLTDDQPTINTEAPGSAQVSGSPFIDPYIVTEEYGWYTGAESSFGRHAGADLASLQKYADVYSVVDGVVIEAVSGCVVGGCGGYGNMITIKVDGKELYVRYGHFLVTLVKEGDHIVKGQKVGVEGATGKVTGVHLHFEVRTAPGYNKDDTVDPRKYFLF
ncbi:M23 family metallopeptidase [Culicoidibacter larvae]|uniref:M23 family metallopeptidase n=1 Tax=Culicoidibacter larvae TaxID=2579976 RepID=A0A5R8Q6W6_9FIRM|nr:M23 family metallopeptidase [Culicoidibacter larvae]TLG71162.1 M23 family metallopeptidase [Culicoidibacter larvae]